MLKIYLVELRRSPLLAALPALILIDILVLFGRARHWIGVWPEASAAAQVVTLFLGPALAAVSAWQAGRASRAGMPGFLQAAARPSWHAEAARLAATLTLGFAAYGIGCLTAAAVSLRDAGPGFLWPSYLLLGAATLTSYAAVGHLVGRFWPSAAFTPVICALGGFVAFLTVGRNYGLFVLSGIPSTMLEPTPVALRLLLAAALCAVAVLVSRTPRSERNLPRWPVQTRRALGCATALSLIILAAIPFAGRVSVERPASAIKPQCLRAGTTDSQVCVWPEHRKYLPELAAMAERLSQIPQPWVKTPATFYQFGLRPTPLGDPGFDISEGHVRPAAIAMAAQVSRDSMGNCLPPQKETRAWKAVNRIDLWLEYRAMGGDPIAADAGLTMTGVSEAQRAAGEAVGMSENEQRTWIARERSHIDKSWCRN